MDCGMRIALTITLSSVEDTPFTRSAEILFRLLPGSYEIRKGVESPGRPGRGGPVRNFMLNSAPGLRTWIPAFAGMTIGSPRRPRTLMVKACSRRLRTLVEGLYPSTLSQS